MSLRIRSTSDFLSGMAFIAIGCVPLLVAGEYPIGTAARMGPGYFPLLIGGMLVLLGSVILVRGLVVEGEGADRFRLKPAVLIFGAMVAFTVLVDSAGLVLAGAVLIAASSLGGDEFRPKEVLLSAIVLLSASVLLFVHALKMPFRTWPF